MELLEQHREVIVDGETAQALDLCRRLLRAGSNLQRVETAQLVLERLRSGGAGDSSDDVNALLRLLGNYVAPTRELTEEILTLLLFCEHRVLLIHHLPKLTYQSKECVALVVQAYLELLATDRSLLVPVLGSLAEMPLDTSEKNMVVEATQSLLDAAVEEDIPAVVQSLLSMLTKASAPKALARLRMECNRINSETLSLTMEVIGRYATAGSIALTAFFRLIRHVETITTFDIILLTFVMGKSAENELAVRTTTSVAQSGRLHGCAMQEASAMIVRPEWNFLLQSFVRFCSCLLAVCFRASTQSTLALKLIATAIDSLIVLVETRSVVQEEALSLLLTIASQPKKLLLLANADSVRHTRAALCWNVAEVIALRFSELAKRNAGALASSSHLFLDHLHGIASATTDAGMEDRYPSHILDLLCATMALLTKKERGIYSLLMITIQKQLVSRVGTSHDQQAFRLQSGRATAVEVKQLMAVFLTGHLLKNQVVIDSRDRKSLANWMLRLLTSANRDETLLHVLRFVRDEMSRAREASALEQERTLLTAAISQVFRKKGLSWTPRDQLLDRIQEDPTVMIAFDGEKRSGKAARDGLAIPLVVDANEFVLKMRFGVPTPAFCTLDANDRDASIKQVEQEYLIKVCLLRELFHCYLEFAAPAEQDKIVDAGFLFPALYKRGLNPEVCASIEPTALNTVIWSLVCALDIAVASANFIAKQYPAATENETTKLFSRLVARLNVCLTLRDQLEYILAVQRDNVRSRLGCLGDMSVSQRTQACEKELKWLPLEVSVVEQMVSGQLRRVQGELPRASLFGLQFRVICLVFRGLRDRSLKSPLSLTHELELLRVLRYHLQLNAVTSLTLTDSNSRRNGGSQELLLLQSEGRKTMEYVCSRVVELGGSLNSEDNDGTDDGSENGSMEATAANTSVRNLMTSSLTCIYDCFVSILEQCKMSATSGNPSWSDKMMAILATSASPGEDVLSCEDPLGFCEIFFRFLSRQCLEMTDPTLACAVIDVLAALVPHTKKGTLVSQLCLAILHQTFPSTSAPGQLENEAAKNYNRLPLGSLPNSVTSPNRGSWCSLAKYRCSSSKWRHIAYLVVGSWSFSPSTSVGLCVLAQYLEEMRILVAAALPHDSKESRNKKLGGDSDEDDLEEKRRQDELAVVVDGEHLVLKSLTNESLPYFIEAILLCAIASLYRAAPKRAISPTHSECNPFANYCRAIDVFETCLQVFAQAEACGFNLPVKTNLLLLRGGAFVTRSVKNIVTKCVGWRVEQDVRDETGALKHLSVLIGAAQSLSSSMEVVQAGFQERVVLKMQRNGTSRRKGGWANELLAKTYGRKYNTRRWISKTEAKLLPFFSYGIEELQDFLQYQSDVNNIALHDARAAWAAWDSSRGEFERRDVMLSDDKLVAACRTLQMRELTATLLKDWRPVMDNDDGESDYDEEELGDSEELDEDMLSEDEDVGVDGFAVKSYAQTSQPAQDNEELGFPTIVVNFKKQKKSHGR